jgi:hypothetical protein
MTPSAALLSLAAQVYCLYDFRQSSGSFATLAATRRALCFSIFAVERQLGFSS